MDTFNEGDKIRATRLTTTWSGVMIEKGEELVVGTSFFTGTPYRSSGELIAGREDRPGEYMVDPIHFELVPEAPKWADVEPGDMVTFDADGEEVTTTATLGEYGRAAVLGLSRGTGLPSNRWTVLSIEKPKPQPPTTPGSVVLIHSGSPAWPNGLPLLLQANGRWIGQGGQVWSDKDVAYANGGTFEVIHAAGKEA